MAAGDFVDRAKPLAEQALWQDIRPVEVKNTRVVNIDLSEREREIFQYFTALTAKGEKSLRGLALTEAVIGINSASYHAWSYRWQTLEALDRKDQFQAEHTFLQHIAAVNAKNYQLWNHKRRLAFKLGLDNAQNEMDFAEECLVTDPKNYHCWAHRQAIVERFGLWEEELLFTEQMILDDVRNNSAWNQRHFIISHSDPSSGAVLRELAFAAKNIAKAPHNTSPWAYVRGLASISGGDRFLVQETGLHSLCQEVLKETPSCSPALAVLADIYAAQMRACTQLGDHQAAGTVGQLALGCFKSLQTTDPMRKHYWQFRSECLGKSLVSPP